MWGSPWITEHWFDLIQTVGIIAGLLFTGYAALREERATKIATLIAANEQYREIWQELFKNPRLSRVLEKEVNLNKESISKEEALFVNLLILHLSTVYRAMKTGMFVKLEGLQKDVQEFFSLPIPKTVWEKAKLFQNKDFVEFIGKCQQTA
jgi:plasmid maintenance system killer protein